MDESWSQRLDALLQRIWARMEAHPIGEVEVETEVEKAKDIAIAGNAQYIVTGDDVREIRS
ncbi:MAG: hypothetical protein NUW24_02395 [Anaerolineae bacterium]|nr:hypothetical protein [Anaerolineae bacterium]MDH7473852.1 hypothetical protein [Anaerolineae bacterium]